MSDDQTSDGSDAEYLIACCNSSSCHALAPAANRSSLSWIVTGSFWYCFAAFLLNVTIHAIRIYIPFNGIPEQDFL
jgi:hypothetical protein